MTARTARLAVAALSLLATPAAALPFQQERAIAFAQMARDCGAKVEEPAELFTDDAVEFRAMVKSTYPKTFAKRSPANRAAACAVTFETSRKDAAKLGLLIVWPN
jgi:hypothetical protein